MRNRPPTVKLSVAEPDGVGGERCCGHKQDAKRCGTDIYGIVRTDYFCVESSTSSLISG
jgi:hypothetical protein